MSESHQHGSNAVGLQGSCLEDEDTARSIRHRCLHESVRLLFSERADLHSSLFLVLQRSSALVRQQILAHVS
eukprot:4510160-Amphidinium_carterae.1